MPGHNEKPKKAHARIFEGVRLLPRGEQMTLSKFIETGSIIFFFVGAFFLLDGINLMAWAVNELAYLIKVIL